MSDSFDDKPDSKWRQYGYVGSRKEAEERGDIIDAGSVAAEAGFRWPLAIVADVYDDCVTWNKCDNDRIESDESETDRLWTVVFSAAESIRQIERHTDRRTFDVFCVNRKNDAFVEERVTLLIVGHANDDGTPCLTIRYPDPNVN